jgi:hypothetical protein
MTRRVFQQILMLCVLTLLTASFCLAQDNAAVVGKWNMTSETNEDPVHWTLILKDVGGKVAGFLTTDQSEQAAKDFKYDAGVITFKAPYGGQDYDIQLKLVGDKLAGTWNGGGDSGRTSGTKAQ